MLYYFTMQSIHAPLIVGLTGNIGTGKSTVLQYLAQKGAHVVDADKLTHQAQMPDGPAYAAIVTAFGNEILNADGTINRPALGKVVFSNAEKVGAVGTNCSPGSLCTGTTGSCFNQCTGCDFGSDQTA